ncbi:hypothetical protein DUI87_05313 [Hirundo rustica rustica]|uniref:BRAT1 protein n=1 Tax=Hirundo rustica rustica TaxID=333673 RepID=A0A3M0KWG1_HIRRU|nr:hypothetical protein DUI87_05313 [Hirundo rustica rustica]
MTRECAVLLPGVCAALADPRQPGLDDTCLEKLLDWFRSLTWFDPTVELVQDNPCLTELLTSVLALPDPSPSILSFTLQLAGILASSESRFQHLQQEKLLARLFGREGPRDGAAWEDASVRSAWVKGVHSMVQHQPALHFLCSTGLLDESVSDPGTVESLLSSKTTCAGLLCQSLAHLEKLLSLVLKKTFQATSKWLVHLQELSCSNSQRQQAEKILEGQKEFRQCLLSSEVLRLTENLLEDPESYVRASAVTAVGHLALVTCFAPESPVTGNQYNKESIVAKLQEILSTDSEGFPRRAVISIFTKWLREGCTGQLEDTEQFVSRVIQTVERDLDWEVRLGGLELVEVFCSQTICQLSQCPYAPVSAAVTSSTPQNELLEAFCRAKLFGFLFGSLCDCDKPVGQRACDVLVGLRGHFYPMSTLENPQEIEDSPAGRGVAWLQRTLRQGSLAQNFPTDGGDGVDFQDPESMMLALGAIDLLELHDELNKSSDHVEESPQSLLQDILATVGTLEDNEVDCY